MYFSKRTLEPAAEEQTAIWSCSGEGCKGWMRDNFAFEEEPHCPICSSAMVHESKMLPVIVNHFSNKKEL